MINLPIMAMRNAEMEPVSSKDKTGDGIMVLQMGFKICWRMLRNQYLVKSVATVSVFIGISTILFYLHIIGNSELYKPSISLHKEQGSFKNGRYLSAADIQSYKGQRHSSYLDSTGCYKIISDRNRLLKKSKKPSVYRVLKSIWISKDLGCTQRFPNGAIIGVKKCGTDALTNFLNIHPSIEASHSGRLSLNLTDNELESAIIDKMGYTTQEQVTLVDQPGFIYAKRSQLDQLAKIFPRGAPLILLIRDPVKRAISDYVHESEVIELMKQKSKLGDNNDTNFPIYELPDTFEAAVLDNKGHVKENHRIITVGRYVEHIKTLIKDHPQLNLFVLDGDLFTQDPYPLLLEIEQFLQIPNFFKREHFRRVEEKGFHCAFVPQRPDVNCLSSKKGRVHPEVEDSVIAKLEDYYRPYNRELRMLLNKTYSWM